MNPERRFSVGDDAHGGITPPSGRAGCIPVWALILLMFIGASPAGTGGGVKTTTCVVMPLSLLKVAIIRRRGGCDHAPARRVNPDRRFSAPLPSFCWTVIFVGVMTFYCDDAGNPIGLTPQEFFSRWFRPLRPWD